MSASPRIPAVTFVAAALLGLPLAICHAQTHPSHPPQARTPARVEPDGPTVVIDTSSGRMVCRLYSKLAPVTSARFIALAKGTAPWRSEGGTPQPGKPFYDGLQIFGGVGALDTGNRVEMGTGSAGPAVPLEKNSLQFDRAGRLAALVKAGMESAAEILIVDHANLEFKDRAVIFGQCDDASVQVASSINHTLMSTDNHPLHPVVLRRIAIVDQGQPMPPPAEPLSSQEALIVASIPPPISPPLQPTGPVASIETTMGTLHCQLFSKEAPIGAANFVGLANGTKAFHNPRTHVMVHGKHFYDGLTFSRVIPDFMVQNGDLPGDPGGGGSIGYNFNNEIHPDVSFDRPGRLAYANAGPGTNASEFFVTEHPLHRLDDNYTIFGQCDDDSVKIVEAIARVPRDEHNKPLKPVVIRHVTFAPAPKPAIAEPAKAVP